MAGLGRLVLGALEELGEFVLLLAAILRGSASTLGRWMAWIAGRALGRPVPRLHEARETLEQMVTCGANSLPVTAVTALFTGMVLALQTGITLEKKLAGVSQYLGGLVAMSLLRELGPVLTALIVTGRVGSAMAAEIGTMKVTEQIDALRTLGTDPVKHLVVPRVLACVLMVPALTVFSDLIGMAGGWLVARARFGQSPGQFIENAQSMVDLNDLFSGLFKTFFFGVIIATVSCHKGFRTAGGAEGVGRSTTSAVVVASMAILVADYALTATMSVF